MSTYYPIAPSTTYPTYTYSYPYLDGAVLERIAVALEKLAGIESPKPASAVESAKAKAKGKK